MILIMIIASVVTGIAVSILLLLTIFSDISSYWPVAAGLACVAIGCIILCKPQHRDIRLILDYGKTPTIIEG